MKNLHYVAKNFLTKGFDFGIVKIPMVGSKQTSYVSSSNSEIIRLPCLPNHDLLLLLTIFCLFN